MPTSGRLLVLAVAIGLEAGAGLAAAQVGAADGLTIRITHRARALGPGEVVRIAAHANRPLTAAQGSIFGRTIVMWPTEDRREWQGLVGISLDAAPGTYELTLRAAADGNLTATGTKTLAVEGKPFQTRRIQVAETFANPPAAETARILRDARLLADTFAELRPERLWDGPFTAPVPGASTSSFGRLTVTNGQAGSRHQGADFRAADGTPVHAPNAGVVVVAEDLFFAGNTVIIDHGYGLYSLFGHLSRIAVQPGAHVARGDRVGDAGATGRVTGPHLHWAVRLGEVSIDPFSLMVAVSDDSADTGR